MYVVGLAAAVLITVRRWEAQGGSRALVYDVAIWGFPAGLIGGRLYFDLTSFNEMPPHWWGPFAVWDGGIGIWGGIALGSRGRASGGCAGPASRSAAFMDAPPRPCSSPRRSAGSATTSTRSSSAGRPPALGASDLTRPPARGLRALRHLPADLPLRADLEPRLAAFLVWLGHHRRIRPPGLFALYVAGYSAFRIFEESPAGRPGPPHPRPAAQLLGRDRADLVGLAWFAWTQRGPRRRADDPGGWPRSRDAQPLLRIGVGGSRRTQGCERGERTQCVTRGERPRTPARRPHGRLSVTPTRSSPGASRRCRARRG